MRSGDWLFWGTFLVALLVRRGAPHLRGELCLGLVFAALWEPLFVEFWTYDPRWFAGFVAPGIPVAMLAFWMTVFLGGLTISERLCQAWGHPPDEPDSWRLLPCDVLAFALLGSVLEEASLRLGLWRYEAGLFLGRMPGLKISVFATLGYVTIGALLPSSVRFWRQHLPFPSTSRRSAR